MELSVLGKQFDRDRVLKLEGNLLANLQANLVNTFENSIDT